MKVTCTVVLFVLAAVVNVASGSEISVSSDAFSIVVHEDWLFQADGKPSLELARKEIDWARQIAARIGTGANLEYELGRLAKLEKRISAAAETQESAKMLYSLVRYVNR